MSQYPLWDVCIPGRSLAHQVTKLASWTFFTDLEEIILQFTWKQKIPKVVEEI